MRSIDPVKFIEVLEGHQQERIEQSNRVVNQTLASIYAAQADTLALVIDAARKAADPASQAMWRQEGKE